MLDRIRLIAVAAAGLAAATAAAQPQQPGQPAATGDGIDAFEPWSPSWSTSEIETLAEALIGAWKTTEPVDPVDPDADPADIVLYFNPVPIDGLSDVLYTEAYRTDNPAEPYRQAFIQFYTYRGAPRMRTLEFRYPGPIERRLGPPLDPKGLYVGLGLVPGAFPPVDADRLIATLDMQTTIGEDGFTARTPYPYPTALHGAVEMTSSIEVTGDTLRTADRGFAPDGSVAWGAGDAAAFEFERAEPHIDVRTLDNNLVILDMVRPEGEPIGSAGRLHVNYEGWLPNGYMFDTSLQSGRQAFVFAYPPQLIPGWNTGLDDVTKGTVRRLIIPSNLGYGQTGQPSAQIPPNTPLYFTVRVELIERSGEAPAQPAGSDS